MSVKPPLLALIGATTSGKSRLAVQVALQLIHSGIDAEVVNTDAMSLYRGMDIGTAKPSPQERRGVVHHLVDVVEVSDNPTVAWFQGQARTVIAEVRARGAVPILVGGSALYLRAVVDQFTFPGTDVEVRARYEAELAEVGAVELHRRLSQLAPHAAAKMEPGNGRRVVRALEVLELTGSFTASLPSWTYELDGVVQIGLDLERDEMDVRIAQRVDRMWEAGLVAEVTALAPALRAGRTAQRALGYRQVLAYLDGVGTQEEAKAATVAGTKRFARKQLSWWRRDPRISWLNAPPLDASAEDLANQVLAVAKLT